MPRMKATEAAIHVLEKEGVRHAFGVPGAAINPLYAAMRKAGSIDHVLARHVEAASHMAEGYTRAVAGNIGVCLGTSGPAGTTLIGSAGADNGDAGNPGAGVEGTTPPLSTDLSEESVSNMSVLT